MPSAHAARKLTVPLPPDQSSGEPLLRVHSGPDKPADAYVAVPYEGEWFWIAGDDWRSKRTFAFVMFMFTLSDTGQTEQLPMITIPAQ